MAGASVGAGGLSAVRPTGTLVELLRGVDGVPHVVLGPVLLVLSGPLAPLLGVPLPALIMFLVVFLAYGVVVVVMTREGRVPAGLTVLAVKTNVVFLAVALLALATQDLTPVGVAVASVLSVSAAGVTAQLVRLGRPRPGAAEVG